MFRAIRYPVWTLTALAIVAVFLIPLGYLLAQAMLGDLSHIRNVAQTILLGATVRTLTLLFGVAVLTAITGTGLAYLITFYRFPARRILSWLVVMPLALPPYIAAYGFVEFLGYTGPIQTGLRQGLAWLWDVEMRSIRAPDYWFPDIASLWGAILILAAVLYPYVYLAVRAVFALQGARVAEVARTLGAGPWRAAFRVVIPLARPAIALGVTLALMESLNDIGAMEYLGVQTLTFSILEVWQIRGSLAGAAGLALFLFCFVALLIWLERWARYQAAFFERRTGQGLISQYPVRIGTVRGALVLVTCLLPPLIGFVLPLYPHVRAASRRLWQFHDPRLLDALTSSLMLAGLATCATLILAVLLVYAARLNPARPLQWGIRLASMGYAVPGTLIGIGLFVPFALFDNALSYWVEQATGAKMGLLIVGSGGALILGYAIRFMALAQGGIDSALTRISPNLDAASRTLGRGPFWTLIQVILPVIWPAMLTVGLLVFIDATKELSATMILQPANLNTLSMYIYGYASDGEVGRTGLPSLILVSLALIPVIMVSYSLDQRTNLKRTANRLF